ncbi:MAG: exosome complex exonuclease Rrp41 [Candidatus Thermoplasmatota archaeon]|nr:exosome complex exonuclease Rrp41 [Candidatus Thermoplasmatota archaeon]
MGSNKDIDLIEDGKRLDGRDFDELREISIDAGVLKRADGSAYLEWGKNKIMAAVYGPREMHPRHAQETTKAVVRARYNMAAFSVPDRKRPGPDRRSTEISKLVSEALEKVVFTENYPRSVIDVFIEVLQASAGTRCGGLTAASVALADAGIPMSDMVASCASGKIEGEVVLDLGKNEDNYGQADVPVGYIPRSDELCLLQMDGNLTQEEYEKAMEMSIDACKDIHEIQRGALRERYSTELQEEEITKASEGVE